MSINSGLNFALPSLPPGTDPNVALLLQPVYQAVYSLFTQVSAQLGQTINDPSLWSTITPDKSLQINGQRKLYLLNSSGATIVAGKLIYITSGGSIALSGTTSATSPIGFITKDCLNGATGELIVGEGLLSGTGLVPGTKYQAGASGGLAAFSTGPAIAIALTTTFIYIRIPIY